MSEWELQDRGYATMCHVWTGTKTTGGYGQTRVRGGLRRRYAHIAAWEAVNGPVPDGLELDHLCRVTSCCNPEHLEAVTHAENIRRGGGTKLTQAKADEIRSLSKAGWQSVDIAAAYGIAPNTVAPIRNGHRWA